MIDVSLSDEALELLKLLEKGAKNTPEGAALEQLRQPNFVMGPAAKIVSEVTGLPYRENYYAQD